MKMGKIIDFSAIKKEKQSEQIRKIFQKPNSFTEVGKINQLVQGKNLSLNDHKFFLAFLGYLEKQNIDPVYLVHSLIKLSKYQFELQFSMNWNTVVEFCYIFLAILKKNEPEQYKKFIELQKFE